MGPMCRVFRQLGEPQWMVKQLVCKGAVAGVQCDARSGAAYGGSGLQVTTNDVSNAPQPVLAVSRTFHDTTSIGALWQRKL